MGMTYAGYLHLGQLRALQEARPDPLSRFPAKHAPAIPAAVLVRDVTQATTGDEAAQGELGKLYTTRPDLEILLGVMTDFGEGSEEWRYRHVKLVERTIGGKRGTG